LPAGCAFSERRKGKEMDTTLKRIKRRKKFRINNKETNKASFEINRQTDGERFHPIYHKSF
jgi:hypothetical protein